MPAPVGRNTWDEYADAENPANFAIYRPSKAPATGPAERSVERAVPARRVRAEARRDA